MKTILVVIICALIGFENAYAAVGLRMENQALLLSESGEEMISAGVYEDIVALTDQLFAAQIGNLYALADGQGTKLTQAVYASMRWSADELIAERDRYLGLLSAGGEEKSAFIYTQIVPTGEGNFWALKTDPNDNQSDEVWILNADGGEQASGTYVRKLAESAASGLISVLLDANNRYGYCNAEGKLAIEAEYDYAGAFVAGLAPVVQGNRYGAINPRGERIVPCIYSYLDISSSGRILAQDTDGAVVLFDETGKVLNRFEGDALSCAFVGDRIVLQDKNALTVVDASGKEELTLPPTAQLYAGYETDLIISDGAWGEECVYLLGSSLRYQNLYPLGSAGGKGVYAYMKANVARYVNDLLNEIQLSVDTETLRYGIVDEHGRILVESRYLSLTALADDRFLARGEQYWEMIDSKGKVYWKHPITQTEEPNSEGDSLQLP